MAGSDEIYKPLSDLLSSVFLGRNELEYIRSIGKGGMSNVDLYRLHGEHYPMHVAVKTLIRKHLSDDERNRLREEADILASFDHGNIIRTFGVAEIESGYGLVLEFHPHGSYADFFGSIWSKRKKTEKDERDLSFLKLRIVEEIINAMKYLHQPRKFFGCNECKNTLHLDLKTDNVLLDEDLHAKICDFGLSTVATLTILQSTRTARSGPIGGTLGFIAPERFSDPRRRPNTKCDVYSFGILQYTILTDLPPYEDLDMQNIILLEHHVVKKHLRPDVSKVSNAYPKPLVDMMKNCWDPVPEDRPSFQELQQIIDDIKESVGDFDAKVTISMNAIVEILDQLDILHEIRLERRFVEAGETGRRSHATTVDGVDNNNVTCAKAPVSTSDQNDSCTVTVEENLITARENARVRSLMQSFSTPTLSPPAYQSYDDELIDLIPCETSAVKEPHRVLRRIILTAFAVVIVSVVLTIGTIVFTNDAKCLSLTNPNHGNVTCGNETKGILSNCHFVCDVGYQIFGTATLSCSAGKWSAKRPTCERACILPMVSNIVFKCTNGTFENSTCAISCKNQRITNGTATMTCLKNGRWSEPIPSCICPECTNGNYCECSTSWTSTSRPLKSLGPYMRSIEFHYGGKEISCASLKGVETSGWYGVCTDVDIHYQITCANDYLSPSIASEFAAAELIRYYVARGQYPKPCDAEMMPTSPSGC